MDPEHANKILNEYGEVLEQVSWLFMGIPESLLPHEKSIIKTAVQCLLPYANDKEDASMLRYAYYSLGKFIDDERSVICFKSIVAIKSGNLNHKWLNINEFSAITAECKAECDRLYQEVCAIPCPY